MRGMFVFLGLLLLGYAAAIAGSVRFNAGQVICVALGLPLLIWGIFYEPLRAICSQGIGASILFVVRLGYAAVGLAVLVFGLLFAVQAAKKPDPGADAVIVLGAGLWGENVTPTLARRLDAALAYLRDNPQTVCVLSGGQGQDEPISEAEAMRRYMKARGVAPERLILESRSVNTHQNIAFSREILGTQARVVVVTSDFHVFRGVALARSAGFAHVQGLSSPSLWYLLPQYCLREIVGVLKDGLLGRLAW